MSEKNFWNTRMQDLTVTQWFLWFLVYMIFLVVVMIAMIVVPQKAEEIWDWIEDKYDRIKNQILHKKWKVHVSKKKH